MYLLILSACSSSTDSSPDLSGVEGFDVELGDDTRYIETHVAETGLNYYDDENHVFRFDADVINDANISLSPGEILFIEGLALRRITSVTEQNGEIIVESESASLNEAFRNADINISRDIVFDMSTLAATKMDFRGKVFSPSSVSIDTVKWEGSAGDFSFEAMAIPRNTEVELVLLVKYETGNVSGAMRSGLTLNSFRQVVDVEIRNHNTENFRKASADFSGTMDLQMVLAGGVANETQFTPDFPKMLVPIPGVPVFVQVELSTIFVTKFDLGINGTASFKTSYDYSGNMGFEFDGRVPKPFFSGSIESPNVSQGEGNAAGFSGTVSGQYGVALPNVGVRLFGVETAYIRQEFYVGAAYTFPTCTEIFSRYVLKGGITLVNNLGFNLNIANPEWTFVDATPHDSKSEGCGSSKFSESSLLNIPAGYLPEPTEGSYLLTLE